jgi:hypothetical protein
MGRSKRHSTTLPMCTFSHFQELNQPVYTIRRVHGRAEGEKSSNLEICTINNYVS